MSHSTPESELVALSFALRSSGLSGLDMWRALLPHKTEILVHEDNQALIRVVQTGRNPTLRYLLRTHRCSVAWLHERFKEGYLKLVYEDTSRQCADIYTKPFTDAAKWVAACDLFNIIS